MQAINGNKDAINSLATTLNCDINSVQTALNTINSGVSQISCDTKLSSCEVINAITSGNASLASQLASCCCQEIINIVRNQYDTYKQRKEAIAKCDEEMAKCQALLNRLGINDKPAKENDEIIALQKEVNELKNIIRKANQMVPPPMKEMLPQDMKNAMDKVGQ